MKKNAKNGKYTEIITEASTSVKEPAPAACASCAPRITTVEEARADAAEIAAASRAAAAACRNSRQTARSPRPGHRTRHRRPPHAAGRPPVSLSLYFWPVISASRVSTVSSCFFTLPTISAPTMFPSPSTIYVVG